ncbi:putative nucleotide kinase [Erwinia phage Zoomie]|uniref:Nucleotide kinase n=1 Tax=Erwinia phage Zoomie TaxID=2851072 RepID=A0A9E6N9F6_9CAUD|nr:putative nucleotide kinase [Erwinia phage Zoomie]
MTEAPQCDGGCQYAKDVGMPEHSCAGTCMYLNHPDNQEVTMKVGDTVVFCNPEMINFYGVTGVVLEVDEYHVTLKDTNGKRRRFSRENCRVVSTPPAPAGEFDVVAKPKHYQFFPDVEAIEIIARSMTVAEFRGYCLGNRLKYRLRAGQKDDPKQELDKSDAYIALFERCKGLCYAE